MTIADQIAQNLVNPEKHVPILNALLNILEDEGEKGVKELIAQWIHDIQEDLTDDIESEV